MWNQYSPKLTDEQAKVVYYPGRLALVTACPGAGKTTTLTARASVLSESPNSKILICTFSRDATEELRRRLGHDVPNLDILTIHAFAFKIIRANWANLKEILGKDKWPDEPVVLDDRTEASLIAEVLPQHHSNKFLRKIQKIRNYRCKPYDMIRLIKLGVYFSSVTWADIQDWQIYESERIRRGLLIFDDMVEIAGTLMEFPEVSAQVLHTWNHVLVDEAQDTSLDQWKLLRPLVVRAESATIVGDLNQSIFGFRDASGAIFDIVQGMDQTVRFSLSQSFRTPRNLAEFANRIATNLSTLIQGADRDGTLLIKGFETSEEEADYVSSNLQGETAILARTNHYLEPVERKLIEKAVPYVGRSYYRQLHVQAWVSAGQLPEDEHIPNDQSSDAKLLRYLVEALGWAYLKKLAIRAIQLESGDVILLTGHAAKGLEWDNVWVLGCHHGQIPHKLATDDSEERNIFYVMCTRPRQKLTLTYVGKRTHYIPKQL